MSPLKTTHKTQIPPLAFEVYTYIHTYDYSEFLPSNG